MSNDSGLNTSELEQAIKDAEAAGNEEDARYLKRVLESRGERKAVVSSHEIVAGNPDAYPERTQEQQEDLADGRPHEPVKADDLGVRGSVDVSGDDAPAAPKASAKK
jgi:hypothetical protein